MNLLLYISILPVILLLLYIYNKDKNKEPKELLIRMFLFGVFTFIPVCIFEGLLSFIFEIDNTDNLLWLFISVFCMIGFVEEFFKWIVVKIIGYDSREFDEVYDAIVYCVCSSLGFAFIENLLYIFESGISTGILRAFTAIPVHTCNGVIMGYYLGIAKLMQVNGNSCYKRYLLLSLFMPVLAHTVYDFLLMSKNVLLIFIWFVIYIVFVIKCAKIVKKVANDEKKIYIDNSLIDNVNDVYYCSNCGNPCETTYCTKCGYKNI